MHGTPLAIGVDIGGTNLRVALVAGDGSLTARSSERIGTDPDAVVARIRDLCLGLRSSAVTAIGIGVPGRVDGIRRTVLSGGYVDLSSSRIVERVEDAVGLPVAIDNDCNMALVAEMAVGAARNRDDVVMFTIGTGIGGAVALGGRIVRGTATAGQLGHLTVSQGGEPCNCGRRGCVETTSSGTALGRHVREAGLPPETRVEDLIQAASRGDARCGEVLLRWVGPLRSAIDSMVAAVSPELVLLGGGLGGAAHRALAGAPAVSPWYRCPVGAAQLGDDAGVIGSGLAAARAAGADGGPAVSGKPAP
ncbi:ROK family protein [Lichenibacterium minor]|uniref:ROK family protein n=1 Tax=Lichenibacterium minor TaxID=2316528 RepID=UPI001FE04950|nr:ROK family protein [Lichenibacterium minor]